MTNATKAVVAVAVLLGGCALPSTRKMRAGYQQLYVIASAQAQQIKDMGDQNQLCKGYMDSASIKLAVQGEQIKQAIEIQARYKPIADLEAEWLKSKDGQKKAMGAIKSGRVEAGKLEKAHGEPAPVEPKPLAVPIQDAGNAEPIHPKK